MFWQTNKWADTLINRQTEGLMYRELVRRTDVLTDEQMDSQTDKQTDRRTDGQAVGQTDR
jgi:hypothetical protein